MFIYKHNISIPKAKIVVEQYSNDPYIVHNPLTFGMA